MNLLSDVYILFVWEFLFLGGGWGGGGREEGVSSKIKVIRMVMVLDMIICIMLNGVYYIILC